MIEIQDSKWFTAFGTYVIICNFIVEIQMPFTNTCTFKNELTTFLIKKMLKMDVNVLFG